MLFCPVCHNFLVTNVRHGGDTSMDGVRYECRTCPYVHKVVKRIERAVPNLKKKPVEDVLGADSQVGSAQTTEAACPECSNGKAYFRQMQIRSADEPMTIFYRCTKCNHRWNEN